MRMMPMNRNYQNALNIKTNRQLFCFSRLIENMFSVAKASLFYLQRKPLKIFKFSSFSTNNGVYIQRVMFFTLGIGDLLKRIKQIGEFNLLILNIVVLHMVNKQKKKAFIFTNNPRMHSSTFVIFILFLTFQHGKQNVNCLSQAIDKLLLLNQNQMIAQLPGGKIVPVDVLRMVEIFQKGKITTLLEMLKKQPKYYTDDGESASEFYYKH